MSDSPQLIFFLSCSVAWVNLGDDSEKHASKLPLEKSKAFPRLCVAFPLLSVLHNQW